jgi:hypothetical protein
MVAHAVAKMGFSPGLDVDRLKKALNADTDRVRNTVPAKQLLIYQARLSRVPTVAKSSGKRFRQEERFLAAAA